MSLSTVISTIAFGFDTECFGNPTNAFRKAASDLFDRSIFQTIEFFFMQSFQNFSRFIGLTPFKRETREFFTEVVEKNVKYREENNVTRNDFLQLLIQLRDSEEGLSLNEMVAHSCE
jgi:cytochrome P450 family 6